MREGTADFTLLKASGIPAHEVLHRAAVLVLPAVRGSRRADIGAARAHSFSPRKKIPPPAVTLSA